MFSRRFFSLCFSVLILAGDIPLQAQTADADAGKINQLIAEAQSLQSRKRYIDAFGKLDEAEKLDPKRPEIFNIRGAIHLALQVRDLDKARDQFRKALELQPDAMPPMFNLAEVEFVGQNWAASEKAFKEVLAKFPKLITGVRHLVVFKSLLCMARQGKFDEAEKVLADNFTFMDDTPAYYFSKAVIALDKKDTKTGNDWLTKAQVIFKKQENSAYLDSLMEAHYIESLATGGDPQ